MWVEKGLALGLREKVHLNSIKAIKNFSTTLKCKVGPCRVCRLFVEAGVSFGCFSGIENRLEMYC